MNLFATARRSTLHWPTLLLSFSAIATAPRAVSQPLPLDETEFQVNSYTDLHQRFPRIAVSDSRDFLIVWFSRGSLGNDGSGESIQARAFRAGGAPLEPSETQVNTYTTSNQDFPEVASIGESLFAITWESAGSWGSDSSSRSIQLRILELETVEPNPAEAQVNEYTEGLQRKPTVAALGEGTFVVVWHSAGSFGSDLDGYSIQARRFRSDGSAIDGQEFQVNALTTTNQLRAHVASAPDGSFVVVWQSLGGDGFGYGIRARRFGADGAPLDPVEFTVNTYTPNDQFRPRVEVDGEGDFVVVWNSFGSAGSDQDYLSVQARRFDRSGAPLDAQEFQVNTVTYGGQSNVDVASDAEGNFIVAWESHVPNAPPPGDLDVVARRFRKNGLPIDPVEFGLSAMADSGWQGIPSIDRSPNGDLAAVWSSQFSAGTDSYASVQARRFGRPRIRVSRPVETLTSPECSLADALRAANTGTAVGGCRAGNEGGVLELPPGGLFELEVPEAGATALPVVQRSVTIQGNGAIVRRDSKLPCPGAPEFRLLEVDDGGILELKDVSVTQGCAVSGDGGAVLVIGGTLILNEATLQGNYAGSDGGGVAVVGGSFLASASSVRSNVAGGSGGGVAIAGEAGFLEIRDSTFAGNTASDGGGVAVLAAAAGWVRNSTISGNLAAANGGGLAVDAAGASMLVEYSTVLGNSAAQGAGGWAGEGTLSFHDSLVGESPVGTDCGVLSGALSATGWNLDTDGSCVALTGSGFGTVASFLVGPLTENGTGPDTHLPLAGSPALDTAPGCSTRGGATIRRDQRRYPRPTDDDGDLEPECDLGAVERGPLFIDGFDAGGTGAWSSSVG